MFHIQKKNKASLYTEDMLVDGSCPAEVDGRWQLGWRDGRWWKIIWKTTSKLDYHLRDILVEEQSPSLSILYFPGNGRQPGRWWKMAWNTMSRNRLVKVVPWSQESSFSSIRNSSGQYFPGNRRQPGRWWMMAWNTMNRNRLAKVVPWSQECSLSSIS